MQHLLKWQPFWKKNSDWHIIFIQFAFSDHENIDIDTNIKFLSSLFAEISDIWKFVSAILKMAPTATTDQCNCHIWIPWRWKQRNWHKINFLSILFADIWDIENSCQPFWKWLPQPPQAKYGWGPVLKHVFMGHSSCVPNVMLVSQHSRFFTKHPDYSHPSKMFRVVMLIWIKGLREELASEEKAVLRPERRTTE